MGYLTGYITALIAFGAVDAVWLGLKSGSAVTTAGPAALFGPIANAMLTVTDRESFGLSYARTLRDWRDRFLGSWPEIESLGFDTRFRRMWEYYLAHCETGFRHDAIDVSIFRLTR